MKTPFVSPRHLSTFSNVFFSDKLNTDFPASTWGYSVNVLLSLIF